MKLAGKILFIIMIFFMMTPVSAHETVGTYIQTDSSATVDYLASTELRDNADSNNIPYSYQGITADSDCEFDNCEGHCPQCNAGFISLSLSADFKYSPILEGHYQKQLPSLVLSTPTKPPRS